MKKFFIISTISLLLAYMACSKTKPTLADFRGRKIISKDTLANGNLAFGFPSSLGSVAIIVVSPQFDFYLVGDSIRDTLLAK